MASRISACHRQLRTSRHTAAVVFAHGQALLQSVCSTSVPLQVGSTSVRDKWIYWKGEHVTIDNLAGKLKE
jgi:hypothetical protein